jgi:hypothetical protein
METGGNLFQRGLNQYGVVNQVISPTVFISSLVGFGDAYFQDWDCWVVRKGTGALN